MIGKTRQSEGRTGDQTADQAIRGQARQSAIGRHARPDRASHQHSLPDWTESLSACNHETGTIIEVGCDTNIGKASGTEKRRCFRTERFVDLHYSGTVF